MPYVKSRSIHATVNKSIAYILDPKKTDGMLLTTSINCTTDAEDAYMQMKMIYEHYSLRSYDEPINKSGKTPVKAIHYIMSFADSENVTPEYAQKVAMAFVRNTFGDDAQAVIATHTNTSYTHCHMILNSYSISGRKYNDNQATLRYVREHANGVPDTTDISECNRLTKRIGSNVNQILVRLYSTGRIYAEDID